MNAHSLSSWYLICEISCRNTYFHQVLHAYSKLTYSCLCVTPWTVARQAPLSVTFSRQEYWSGLPCPPPGDLPDPGVEPASLMSFALVGRVFTAGGCYCQWSTPEDTEVLRGEVPQLRPGPRILPLKLLVFPHPRPLFC